MMIMTKNNSNNDNHNNDKHKIKKYCQIIKNT